MRVRRVFECVVVSLAALLMSGAFVSTRTATAGGQSITSVTVSATPQNYVGACLPAVRVALTGTITASGPVGTVTVQFRYGDGRTSNPIPISVKSKGTYQARHFLHFSASWNTTAQLLVLAPEPSASKVLTLT